MAGLDPATQKGARPRANDSRGGAEIAEVISTLR